MAETSPHRNFVNFLATDKVPESIFGIPVVQGGYSEEDAAFFRDNPKAAGFYEMGDETVGEDTPQQAAAGGMSDEEFETALARLNGTPEAEPKGGDNTSILRRFEKTGGTETDAISAMYNVPAETAAKIRGAVVNARADANMQALTRTDIKLRYQKGTIGLEGIAVPTAAGAYGMRQVLKTRKDDVTKDGVLKVVGSATTGASSWDHDSVKRDVLYAKRHNEFVQDYNFDRADDFDAAQRSAAYPGNSVLVVHDEKAAEEELTHMLNRSITASADADVAAANAGVPDATNRDAPYFVYGNRDERIGAMARLKHAYVRMDPKAVGDDGTVDVPGLLRDDKALDRLSKHSAANTEDNRGVKAVVDEFRRLKGKVDEGKNLSPSEQNAWSDLNSDRVWNSLAYNEDPEKAARAAVKGGQTCSARSAGRAKAGGKPRKKEVG